MQYLLMIYGGEAAMQNRSQEEIGRVVGAFMAYTEAVKSAGVLVGSNRLRPTSTATTVRLADATSRATGSPSPMRIAAAPSPAAISTGLAALARRCSAATTSVCRPSRKDAASADVPARCVAAISRSSSR